MVTNYYLCYENHCQTDLTRILDTAPCYRNTTKTVALSCEVCKMAMRE